MFATMVVQLPSVHQGGQLQVFKGDTDNHMIHDFGASAGTAQPQCNYAVHYADAEHKVLPVTKGYRLALVYSICLPEESTQPAPSPLAIERAMPLLKPLAELADADRDFHYYFKHEYTPDSITKLGVRSLEGEDQARLRSLRIANEALPADQRFNFYLLHCSRYTLSSNSETWNIEAWGTEEDKPEYQVGPLYSLKGKQLAKRYRKLEDADVLNPDKQSRAQRWRGHRTVTHSGNLGNEAPSRETTYEKYLLLAWPAKSTDSRMLALIGVGVHFRNLLSRGADQHATSNFVQRVVKMKQQNCFDHKKHTDSGRNLYKHIASKPELHHLIPDYFELFPCGSHVPEDPPRSYSYSSTYQEITTTPFIDVFQTIQKPDIWETLGDKIINGFAGKTLYILKFLEEATNSTILLPEVKGLLNNKLLELFRYPADVITDPKALNAEKLQQKLWSVILANEGTDALLHLARTYVAYFPQGGFAKLFFEGERFKDLLRLATLGSTWDAISPAVVKGFETDMEGALIFVQLCKARSLPRSIWLPFLNVTLCLCGVPSSQSALAPKPGPSYLRNSASSNAARLKAMWDTAMMLDINAEGGESDLDAASKLLKEYVKETPISIYKAADTSKKSRSKNPPIADFTDIIQLAKKFPTVWDAAKFKTLPAMGSDMEIALRFIKECRLADLPDTVWGHSVDVCTSIRATPTDAELNDEALQALLWRVAVGLRTPTLCKTTAERYMAVSTINAGKARKVLTAVCRADSSAFEDKRTALEPLFMHWLHGMEMILSGMQKKTEEAGRFIFSDGSVPLDNSLDAFIRGPEKTFKITRRFGSLADARRYTQRIYFRHSSATAVVNGRGRDTFVLITKTLEHAQDLEAKTQRLKEEQDQLRELLSLSNEDRPPPSKKPRLDYGEIIVID